MKETNHVQRILSFVMALVMVIGMFPIHAHAAASGKESETIFFATDLHAESSKLNSLLKALDYEPGLVVLGGDHVNNTDNGSLASITSNIQNVYPGVQTFFTYAAHDTNVSEDTSNSYAYARTGEYYEGDDYYVYALDQGAMDSTSGASSASNAFKTWAAGTDSSKVIFVVCHMPIHSRRGDNAGGATWMNTLNDVGQTHDIVYLWGHNHTGESSSDTSVYFVGVGGSLTPQGGTKGTINFTYMNAGYIKNGYASMVQVESDHVDVTRYSTSGSATASYTIERRFAVSHEWELTEGQDATCTADGFETYVCTECGETKTTVLPATGHDYDEESRVTCTGAYTVYTCAVCGHSYTEELPGEITYDKVSSFEEGESYVIVASGYALTYGSSVGKTAVTVAGNAITSSVSDAMVWKYAGGKLSNSSSGSTMYINATGSSTRKTIKFDNSGASVSYSSSKLKIGSTYLYYSSSSGFSGRSSGSNVTLYKVNEAMAPTGEHMYTAVRVEPTCTEDGSVTYTCDFCGETYVEVLESNGQHNYETVTVPATCGSEGFVSYTCTDCGDTYREILPATGDHNYIVGESAAPTCTEEGSVLYTCACGDSYTEVIPAKGHSYESVVTAPTCTEDGYTTYTCACGDSYVSDQMAALGHSYTSKRTEPTCTKDGSIVYTCACGDSYTEVISAKGHSYERVVTAPTCTEEGYTTYTCACGDSYVADQVAALGHTYESVVTAPTCTEEGYTTYTCACGHSYVGDETSALGHSYTAHETEATCETAGGVTYTCHCGHSYADVEIPALGHDLESVVTAPTCADDGYTTHTCRRCGKVTVDSHVAALGHDVKTETLEPTCTEAGSITETCTRCGETHTEVLEPLGHDYKSVVTAPTCTVEGFTTYTCACGHSYVSDKTPALGHSYTSKGTEPTCTKDGSIVYTCACGDSYTEVIPAKGHSYESVVTAPTCTEEGYTTYTCACGDSYVSDQVAALGHTYESVVTAPTCTEDGYTTYTCACGDSYAADQVAALGHTYESVVTAPTCTEDGYTTYTCACGDSYVADQVAALGHSYTTTEQNGVLIHTCACGHSYSEQLDFSYSQVSTFTSGGNFVITVKSGSKYYALSHSGNSLSAVQVSVSNGEITSEITENLLWTYADGKLSYVSDGTTHYLYTYTSGWWFWSTTEMGISTSNSADVSISGTKLKIGSSYLRYSGSKLSLSSSAGAAYIFLEN